jgi:two-component system LytT family response regulator
MRYGLTPIIMVTSIASMEMEAYRSLHCYQYLIKPYMKVDVENIVSKLIALEHVKEEKTIIVKKDGINYRIKCNAIVYAKAIPRGICLYLKKEVMKVPYLTIVKLMEQLDTSEFIQCHRMFVVNKKYIENVDFVNRMIRMEYYNEDIEIGGTYKNHLKEILD